MQILVNNVQILFEGLAGLIPGTFLGIALAGPSDCVLSRPPLHCLLISVGPEKGAYNLCQSMGLGLTDMCVCVMLYQTALIGLP